MRVTFSSSLVSSPKCFNKLDNSDLFVTLEFGYHFGKIKDQGRSEKFKQGLP